MAGVTFPNVVLPLTAATLTALGDVIPAGKYESVCLLATLHAGTADAYLDVSINDTLATNEGMIRFQEPVRYRQPGGSPDLLLNFILNPGQQLQVQASGANLITVTLFNRWRFDA